MRIIRFRFSGKSILYLFVVLPLINFISLSGQLKAESNSSLTGYGPYCGIECLYVLIKHADSAADIRDLLQPEFISSRKGSSLYDLKKAAISSGFSAEVITNLNCSFLVDLPYPIILHVKSKPDKLEYDHYWLYTGVDDGKICVFDPPSTLRKISIHQLAPVWDGNGLIVSNEAINIPKIMFFAKKRFICIVAIILICLAVFHFFRVFIPYTSLKRSRCFCMTVIQAVGLVGCIIVMGLLIHFFGETGFLAHPENASNIIHAHAGSFIRKISCNKAVKLLASETVFIDARFKRDYEAGHIKSAISLPINCPEDEYKQTISALPMDKKIVLYCQSAGCKYAEEIAIRLKEDGFEDLAIFKGGWVEWQKFQKPKTVKAEGKKNEKETVS